MNGIAIESAHSTCVRKSSPLAPVVAVAEDAWRATPGRPALLALPLAPGVAMFEHIRPFGSSAVTGSKICGTSRQRLEYFILCANAMAMPGRSLPEGSRPSR